MTIVDSVRGDAVGESNADSDSDCDIVIIGAGPVGLVAAALLGRRWRVTVIERHPNPYGLPRAGHVDHEVLRILQGIQAHQPLLDDGVAPAVYRWLNGDGQTLFEFDLADGSTGFPNDLMMYQPVLEDALRASVARQGSRITTLMGWEATSVEDDGSGVTAIIQQKQPDGSNRTRRVRGTYLLAADGARSTVRRVLGIGQTDIGFAEDWLDVDVRLRQPLGRDIDGQFCDPARPVYIGSLGKRHHRFEFARLPGESWADLEEPAKAWALMAEHGITPDDVEIVRQVVYRFEAKLADSWRQGRVFLLGDAAHTMPPHFGQGMCSGVRDAAAIGWRLDLVLRGEAADGLLDTYQLERGPHAEQWIDNSVRIGRISCTLDREAAEKRDAEIFGGNLPLFPPPQLDRGVFQTGDTAALAAPAGEFSPQGRVEAADRVGLFHDVVGHGFVLIWRGPDFTADLDEATRGVLDRFEMTLCWLGSPASVGATGVVRDIDGTYAEFLDRHGADALVLRPDYHVFGVTRGAQTPAELLAELDQAVPAAASDSDEKGTP